MPVGCLVCARVVAVVPLAVIERVMRFVLPSSWTHAEHRNELECVECPVTRMNTIINACPQGERIIMERFGVFHREVEPGLFFPIPGVDEFAFCEDMRERTLAYTRKLAITKGGTTCAV